MNRQSVIMVLLVVGAVVLSTPRGLDSAETSGVDARADIRLPKPDTSGGMTLTAALSKRRSHRSFADKPVSVEQISQLCWAAQGITESKRGLRTAPSAMTKFSIGVFLVDDKAVCEYLAKQHALRPLHSGNMLAKLRESSKRSQAMGTAPLCMVLTMEVDRLKPRAGAKAERYCLMESGHVAQNVLLQAAAIGLASVPVGGIDEAKVTAALNLPKHLRPVYVLPLGYASDK